MNKHIRYLSAVVAVMFFALLANLTFSATIRHNSLTNSDQNRRVRNEQFDRERGAITAGSEVVAESVASSDHFSWQRTYPHKGLYAHVSGFYSYDFGTSGLERAMNAELAGDADSLALGTLWDRLSGRPPVGASVETTIDPAIQRAAAAALGDSVGAIVAIDPATGAVLALVSNPTYDPNRLATHDVGAEQKAWDELASAEPNGMRNRAARELYPPGSTFKLIVTAAALADGKSADSKVDTPDELTLPGTSTRLGNLSNCGNTKIPLSVALEKSCNTAFANLGMELGEEKLAAQAAKFGFGSPHLQELGGVASRFPTGMDDAQVAMSSIGQFDVASNPLQMAMVAAAIANDGVVMEPYLVQTVRGPNLEVVARHEPTEFGRAVETDDARELTAMMTQVVRKGSGVLAQVPGHKIAGKTGTSEHGSDTFPYGWFVAFDASENPEIAVAVFVEDAPSLSDQRRQSAGYAVAAPIAQKVLQAALS